MFISKDEALKVSEQQKQKNYQSYKDLIPKLRNDLEQLIQECILKNINKGLSFCNLYYNDFLWKLYPIYNDIHQIILNNFKTDVLEYCANKLRKLNYKVDIGYSSEGIFWTKGRYRFGFVDGAENELRISWGDK